MGSIEVIENLIHLLSRFWVELPHCTHENRAIRITGVWQLFAKSYRNHARAGEYGMCWQHRQY
jgi:hypothetical protein